MLIQGTVMGDLCCIGTVTLTASARSEGSIEYGQIEIEKGATVKGELLVSSAGSAGSRSAAKPGSNSKSVKPVQPSLS